MGLKSPSRHKFSELLHTAGVSYTAGAWQRKPLPALSAFSSPELQPRCICGFFNMWFSLSWQCSAHTIPYAWKAPYLVLSFSTNSVYLSRLISEVFPPSCLPLTRLSAFTLDFHNPGLSFIIHLEHHVVSLRFVPTTRLCAPFEV